LIQLLSQNGNLSEYNPQWPFIFEDTVFISINILNQLDNLIIENARKRHEKEEIIVFRKKIQQFHVDNLSKDSILITDFIEHDDCSGIITKKELIKCSLNEFLEKDSWIWGFDHLGNYRPRTKVNMEVKGFVKK
jgi:hypothetical protein